MKQPPLKRKRAILAFLPALVVTGVVAGAAAGISLIPMATAATVIVSGEVDAALNIPAETTDPANNGGLNCSDSSGNASFAVTDGWEAGATATGNCNINFGSTSGQVRLTFENANTGSYFYCNHPGGGARSCAAGVDRVGNVAAGAAISADTFGIALNDTPVNAAAPPSGVTEDANNNAIPADTGTWYPIPNNGAPAELCRSSAAGTATCQIRFGLQGKGAAPLQNPGSYDGTLQITLDSI